MHRRVGELVEARALLGKFPEQKKALETRAAAEGLTLKQTDQLLKDVKLAVGTMGPLPTKQDREDLMVRLQAVRTSLTPRIQELREAEEWKRWANVQVQEELCTKMEALVTLADTDPEKASTEMRVLQERWKPVAAAPNLASLDAAGLVAALASPNAWRRETARRLLSERPCTDATLSDLLRLATRGRS